MATGDISNNIRKMRSMLKAIKYTEDFDVNLLAEGQPAAYLPIYHYAFTNYSPPLAQLILDKGIELYGKSDARFMEAVYKILRDVFAYKPPITKEQFFVKGFAERKVIMCTEIIQHVKKKHLELNPAPPKTAMKTSVRPKSAPETKHLPLAVPKTKPETRRVSPRDTSKNMQRHAPQVVNELTSMPVNEPVRHLSTSASHPHPVRHVAGHDLSDDSESLPRSILSSYDGRSQPGTKHVSIKSPREISQTALRHEMSRPMWKFEDTPDKMSHVKSNFMTPSIKKVCTKSVEVVSMPKGFYDEDKDEDTSIVEIQAQTSDSVLQSPVPTSNLEIASLYQIVENLTGHVMQIAESQQVAGNDLQTDDKMEKVFSKIENLTARIVLLENRMSIIENKMGEVQLTASAVSEHSNYATGQVNQSSIQRTPVLPVTKETVLPKVPLSTPAYTSNNGQGDISVDSPGLFKGPGNSFCEELKAMSSSQKAMLKDNSDFSLNYSPIRRVANGLAGTMVSANEDTFATEMEDDARRSSTPTFGGTFLGDSSMHCDISHLETKDTVARIHNMMKETTHMMKDKEGTLQAPEVDIGS